MADKEFSTFPSNKLEALSMLYLQQQDLTGLSPEEVLDLYNEIYIRISEQHRNCPKSSYYC